MFFRKDYRPYPLNRVDIDDINKNTASGSLLKVRPQKDENEVYRAKEVIKTLYRLRLKNRKIPFLDPKNVTGSLSFEVWFDREKLKFLFYPGNKKDTLKKQLRDKYPKSIIKEKHRKLPEFKVGDYISCFRFSLERKFYIPIKNPSGIENFSRDPLGGITSEIVVNKKKTFQDVSIDPSNVKVLLQVLFKPIKKSWCIGSWFGIDCREKAHILKQDKIKGGIISDIREISRSRKEKQTAEKIARQYGKPGFYTDIRILTASQSPIFSNIHTKKIATILENQYRSAIGQTLNKTQIPKNKIKTTLKYIAKRQHRNSFLDKIKNKLDLNKLIFTIPELAGIVHLPSNEIETPKIEWARMDPGPGVPTDTTKTPKDTKKK